MSNSVIIVSNLKKYFKVFKKDPGIKGLIRYFFERKAEEIKAVDNISFGIDEGELVGFLGPNGAGKTTTLKCLSGLLYPTSGEISVLGFKPWERKEEFLQQISLVMGQKNQLWWDLPVIETFSLNKEIYEIPRDEYEKNLEELTTLLEVKDILKVQVRKLSLGQRARCEIIAALLHSPKILFLDEPTLGLDIVSQKKIRDFIREYNRNKKATIILTSHNMDDIKELCKRVLIIDKGKLIFDGSLQEITQKYTEHKIISIIFSKEIDPKTLEKIGKTISFSFPKATLAVKREVAPMAAAELLQNYPILDLNIEEVSVEDIIRSIFTGQTVS